MLLDLPQAVRLRDGDGLALDDGGVVRVCAQARSRCWKSTRMTTARLVRIAWHLGNRHLPVQLLGDRIRIRADHVIEEMVEGLGGHVDAIEAPFDPEAGAYAGGHHHHHDDDDDASPPRLRDRAMAADQLRRLGQPPRAVCSACWPGCRRRSRPAPSPIRTAWNGRSNAATSRDGDTLRAWLADVLAHGAGRNDAILLRHAHRAARRSAALSDIAELAAAIAPARERRTETLDQGTAFVAAAAAWASARRCRSASPIPSRSARSPARMASTKTPPPPPICRPSPPT